MADKKDSFHHSRMSDFEAFHKKVEEGGKLIDRIFGKKFVDSSGSESSVGFETPKAAPKANYATLAKGLDLQNKSQNKQNEKAGGDGNMTAWESDQSECPESPTPASLAPKLTGHVNPGGVPFYTSTGTQTSTSLDGLSEADDSPNEHSEGASSATPAQPRKRPYWPRHPQPELHGGLDPEAERPYTKDYLMALPVPDRIDMENPPDTRFLLPYTKETRKDDADAIFSLRYYRKLSWKAIFFLTGAFTGRADTKRFKNTWGLRLLRAGYIKKGVPMPGVGVPGMQIGDHDASEKDEDEDVVDVGEESEVEDEDD